MTVYTRSAKNQGLGAARHAALFPTFTAEGVELGFNENTRER